MERLFHVCTIANDLTQYEAQRRTFADAGFTGENCRFTLFDNSASNRHEPYATINETIASTAETFVIFCHQDIRLPGTASFDHLSALLTELERLDSKWVVCGNAGGMSSQQIIKCITDPSGTYEAVGLPQPVQSLDECFLVLKARSGLRCSPGLAGFHFYGTDLCLNALAAGRSAYVIHFHLIHLSTGNMDKQFRSAQQVFCKIWSPHFLFRYVRTTCTSVFLSRWWLFRVFFSRGRVICWFLEHPNGLRVVAAIQRKFRYRTAS